MEEAAEVVSGINILKETGNADNLKEELGDLLLQVVMHAQIAEEEGLFTMEDVIGGITEKMIRRHPHVFGETDDAGKAADLGRTGSGRENICCAEPGQTDHGPDREPLGRDQEAGKGRKRVDGSVPAEGFCGV